MAELPDDVIEGTPERAGLTLRLGQSGADNNDRIELAQQGMQKLLMRTEHLEWSSIQAGHPGWQEYEFTLWADRTAVVGPALDELCAMLREAFADLTPQVKVPGYVRTFYGWERAIWDAHGRFVEGA